MQSNLSIDTDVLAAGFRLPIARRSSLRLLPQKCATQEHGTLLFTVGRA
jgi:hypothetical protein